MAVKPCPRRVRNRRPPQKEVDTVHNVANKQALRAKLIMITPWNWESKLSNK